MALFPRQGLGKILLSFTNQKFTHRQRCHRVSGYVTLFLLKRLSGNSQSSPHCMICSRHADCEKNGLSGSKLTHSLTCNRANAHSTDAASKKCSARGRQGIAARFFKSSTSRWVRLSVISLGASERPPPTPASTLFARKLTR